MIHTTTKLRPPTKMHGGKAYLARDIVALMPNHRVYCEPFMGGASVGLNKSPSAREAWGDVDPGLVNLWRVIQHQPYELMAALRSIDYTEENFHKYSSIEPRGLVKLAVKFLVVNRFSRDGLGKDFSWSDRLRGKRQPGGPIPGDANAWNTIRASIPALAERIKNVLFFHQSAFTTIRQCDGPDTLHYLDPPYLHSTRTARSIYRYEMTIEDHLALLNLVVSLKGQVMLSGYRSDLYDDVLARPGWYRWDKDMPNHASQAKVKQRRTESVWMNFKP